MKHLSSVVCELELTIRKCRQNIKDRQLHDDSTQRPVQTAVKIAFVVCIRRLYCGDRGTRFCELADDRFVVTYWLL